MMISKCVKRRTSNDNLPKGLEHCKLYFPCPLEHSVLDFAAMTKKTLTREFFQRMGRRGGKLSSRTSKLTPEQRSELAKKAAVARWGKTKT